MVDSDIKVACQQACPTNAINFGNANDKESSITKTRLENPNRQFYVLEQLHVMPNVTYMAKVRNADEEHEVGKEEKHEVKHEEKKAEVKAH